MLKVFAAASAALLLTGAASAADRYKIDPTHVWINFSIRQAPWASYLGAFHGIRGEIVLDRDNLTASSVHAEILANSIDTSNGERDQGELQLEGFLNGAAFPLITYDSTAIERTGETTGKITGDLTMAGVTVPVVLDTRYNGEGRSDWDGSMRIGFSATGMLDTNDFGMTGIVPLNIGPRVDFVIEVEATKCGLSC